jgi:2-dehydropantoate 2-reductase
MVKIVIAGVGAVGGYFGGKLAVCYEHSQTTCIYFIARGEHEAAIRSNGLMVESSEGSFVARPKWVGADAGAIGTADYLVCCTKGYDLVQTIHQLKPLIGSETVVLPLLNGVDSVEIIQSILPGTEVWDGCVYLVSRLLKPGWIKETGNLGVLHFGSAKGNPEKLKQLLQVLTTAGIDARLSANILQPVWDKFMFISTIATITSYYNECIGGIRENEAHRKDLLLLLNELKMVADKKQVPLTENILQKVLDRMDGLPYDTTSSMHSDFQKNHATELESLTGYVIRQAELLGISVPVYSMMYNDLKERTNLAAET